MLMRLLHDEYRPTVRGEATLVSVLDNALAYILSDGKSVGQRNADSDHYKKTSIR